MLLKMYTQFCSNVSVNNLQTSRPAALVFNRKLSTSLRYMHADERFKKRLKLQSSFPISKNVYKTNIVGIGGNESVCILKKISTQNNNLIHNVSRNMFKYTTYRPSISVPQVPLQFKNKCMNIFHDNKQNSLLSIINNFITFQKRFISSDKQTQFTNGKSHLIVLDKGGRNPQGENVPDTIVLNVTINIPSGTNKHNTQRYKNLACSAFIEDIPRLEPYVNNNASKKQHLDDCILKQISTLVKHGEKKMLLEGKKKLSEKHTKESININRKEKSNSAVNSNVSLQKIASKHKLNSSSFHTKLDAYRREYRNLKVKHLGNEMKKILSGSNQTEEQEIEENKLVGNSKNDQTGKSTERPMKRKHTVQQELTGADNKIKLRKIDKELKNILRTPSISIERKVDNVKPLNYEQSSMKAYLDNRNKTEPNCENQKINSLSKEMKIAENTNSFTTNKENSTGMEVGGHVQGNSSKILDSKQIEDVERVCGCEHWKNLYEQCLKKKVKRIDELNAIKNDKPTAQKQCLKNKAKMIDVFNLIKDSKRIKPVPNTFFEHRRKANYVKKPLVQKNNKGKILSQTNEPAEKVKKDLVMYNNSKASKSSKNIKNFCYMNLIQQNNNTITNEVSLKTSSPSFELEKEECKKYIKMHCEKALQKIKSKNQVKTIKDKTDSIDKTQLRNAKDSVINKILNEVTRKPIETDDKYLIDATEEKNGMVDMKIFLEAIPTTNDSCTPKSTDQEKISKSESPMAIEPIRVMNCLSKNIKGELLASTQFGVTEPLENKTEKIKSNLPLTAKHAKVMASLTESVVKKLVSPKMDTSEILKPEIRDLNKSSTETLTTQPNVRGSSATESIVKERLKRYTTISNDLLEGHEFKITDEETIQSKNERKTSRSTISHLDNYKTPHNETTKITRKMIPSLDKCNSKQQKKNLTVSQDENEVSDSVYSSQKFDSQQPVSKNITNQPEGVAIYSDEISLQKKTKNESLGNLVSSSNKYNFNNKRNITKNRNEKMLKNRYCYSDKLQVKTKNDYDHTENNYRKHKMVNAAIEDDKCASIPTDSTHDDTDTDKLISIKTAQFCHILLELVKLFSISAIKDIEKVRCQRCGNERFSRKKNI